MGAWGTGIYDNDIALDFMGKVSELISEQAEFNEEVLVMADLLGKYSYPTPLDNALISTTIKKELNNLEHWKEECREERKQVLLDLLNNSTRAYINKNKDLIIYPYKIDNDKLRVQEFLSDGGVLCEYYSIDMIMKNYDPIWDYNFTIKENGLDLHEVEQYFQHIKE